ncbi:MAG: cysteine hydrolase [Alphaproteobacteria bacterium]|nr:cysteine hydrolase [Alphaproteobacteria bacterium]
MPKDTFSAHRHDHDTLILSPHHTAILVVDMLNDFCSEGGAMVLPGAERLYGPQNTVIAAARAGGAAVAFVNDCHRPEMRRDREFLKREPHCIEGTWGAEIVDALDQQDSDIRVVKRRFSGFFNTDLDLTLKDMEVDAVVVMGVVTNICVRSTAHDAFFHGYRIVVPDDCVAATGPREQESSLYDIATHFGWVSEADEVARSLTEGTMIAGKEIPA